MIISKYLYGRTREIIEEWKNRRKEEGEETLWNRIGKEIFLSVNFAFIPI